VRRDCGSVGKGHGETRVAEKVNWKNWKEDHDLMDIVLGGVLGEEVGQVQVNSLWVLFVFVV